MSKIKNVLSLFDGMSCGQAALNRAGVKYDNYYASEIEDSAIAITLKNFPNTIHIGSVVDIKPKSLPQIDLIMFGSPCTDLSRAGKGLGMRTTCGIKVTTLKQYLSLKKEGKEFHGQSYLFWEAIRVLKALKPKYFLLENTLMDQEWRDIISKELGVQPVKINSSLLSAQNRERLYWTNLPGFKMPEDRGILLTDLYPNTISAGIRGRKFKGDDFYTPTLTTRKDGKANCLVTSPSRTNLIIDNNGDLKTISIEQAEVLQTLSKGYTDLKGVSKAARYKMIGNGWTVDVITHFFKCFKNSKQKV
jgi:DNA (cytosine-5)-methyltransferase 3A